MMSHVTVQRQFGDVKRLLQALDEELEGIVSTQLPFAMARAPGRLDVMGGIADYSGSLVLQMPIAEAAVAAVQHRSDDLVGIAAWDGDAWRHSKLELALLRSGYSRVREHFQAKTDPWAAYIAGGITVLEQEGIGQVKGGIQFVVRSEVPIGKGVSSSAAIEVASMQALGELLGLQLAPDALAVLCQKVENLVVGAPCGIMDQMTSACGQEHQLLELLCQPATILGNLPLPEGVCVWGIESGIRHAVSGADYGQVRTAAFMGYQMLAEAEGYHLPADLASAGSQMDAPWGGYLANVPVSRFRSRYAGKLPESMSGREFLSRYTGIIDRVTRVEPDKRYPVLAATEHPVQEHDRVRTFRQLLRGQLDETTFELLGELMYQSHASYSACGLGSEGTDHLVELVREHGPSAGLYGAKITGGGSGGTVAVLGRPEGQAALRKLAERYQLDTGRNPHVFSGSSPGAATFSQLTQR